MTVEVLILNRNGVALAADSAVILLNRSGKGKFSNSANKLFRLSKRSSIGVLIYGDGGVNGIPLEVLIKDFRAKKRKAWPTVQACSNEFISYLNGNQIDQEESDRQYLQNVTLSVMEYWKDAYQKVGLQILSDQASPLQQTWPLSLKRWPLSF